MIKVFTSIDRVRYAGVRLRVSQERGQHHDEERSGRGAGRDHLLGLWLRSQEYSIYFFSCLLYHGQV